MRLKKFSYDFRLWLAFKLMKWGKQVHPDIARLQKQIRDQNEILSRAYIMCGIKLKPDIEEV